MQFTLKKRWHSRKDYSYHKSFRRLGASLRTPSPPYLLSTILNQGPTEECTAYAACAIRESMKGKQYDPTKQWQEELAVYGQPSADGVDLDTQMATGVKTGFVPLGSDTPTDKASAYFSVTPTKSIFNPSGLDLYDSIKRAMTQQQAPLSGGLDWYDEWTNAPGGIVPNSFQAKLGGHDVKLAGFKVINGTEYLVIQNSWGVSVGDHGLFYFSRDLVNQVFAGYGVRFWSDDPDVQVQRNGLLLALLQNLLDLYQSLLNALTPQPAPQPMPQPTPQPAPAPSPQPTPPDLSGQMQDLAAGIFEAEGDGKQAGMKWNNRGDIRWPPHDPSYVLSLGATAASPGGLAIFRTMADGDHACVQLCTDAASDRLLAFKGTMTLSQFCKVYAQPPVLETYVAVVLKHLKVGTTAETQIRELL